MMSASGGEVPGSVRRLERRETPRSARAGSGRLRARSDPSSTRSETPGRFPRGEVDEAGVPVGSIDSRAWGEATAFQAYCRALNELDERYAWEQRELFTDADGSFSFDGCLVAGQAGTPPRQVRAQIALWFTDVARMLQFAARTAAIGFRVVQRALLALARRSPPSPDDAGDASEPVDSSECAPSALPIRFPQMQLVCAAAMLIAAKYEETETPNMADRIAYVACVPVSRLLQTEVSVLQLIDWRVGVVTVDEYVACAVALLEQRFVADAGAVPPSELSVERMVRRLALQLLEASRPIVVRLHAAQETPVRGGRAAAGAEGEAANPNDSQISTGDSASSVPSAGAPPACHPRELCAALLGLVRATLMESAAGAGEVLGGDVDSCIGEPDSSLQSLPSTIAPATAPHVMIASAAATAGDPIQAALNGMLADDGASSAGTSTTAAAVAAVQQWLLHTEVPEVLHAAWDRVDDMSAVPSEAKDADGVGGGPAWKLAIADWMRRVRAENVALPPPTLRESIEWAQLRERRFGARTPIGMSRSTNDSDSRQTSFERALESCTSPTVRPSPGSATGITREAADA